MSSSTEDDEWTIKLDAHVEIEMIVRNDFEDGADPTNFSLSPTPEEYPDRNDSPLDISEKVLNTRLLQSETCEYGSSARSEEGSSSTTEQSSEDYQSPRDDSEADSPRDESEDKSQSSKDESKEKASTSKDSTVYPPFCKDVNCKELIIFCVDISSDMEKVPFTVFDENSEWIQDKWEAIAKTMKTKGAEHTPLIMVKRVIEMFVHNKHFINPKHRFALMVLSEKATWICEFTKDPKIFVGALEDLCETVDCNSCDLASIVSLISSKYPFLLNKDYRCPDLQAVLRIILIYGRANCIAEFSDPKAKEFFTEYPHIFLDILYLHEPISEENKISEILNHLHELRNKSKSYIFEVGRSTTGLHNAMGKLLSHPFQRLRQEETDYKLANLMPSECDDN